MGSAEENTGLTAKLSFFLPLGSASTCVSTFRPLSDDFLKPL